MKTQYFINEGKSSEVVTAQKERADYLLAMMKQEWTPEGWVDRLDLEGPYKISRTVNILDHSEISLFNDCQSGKFIFIACLTSGFYKPSTIGGIKLYKSNFEDVIKYMYANNTMFSGYKTANGAIKSISKYFK